MPFEPSLDELVVFELPIRPFAERLLAQLAPTRLAWMQPGDGGTFLVAALLSPDQLDVAVLLRTVQEWLPRTGLGSIRFELDGRTYLLDAAARSLAVR